MKFLYLEEQRSADRTESIIINADHVLFMGPAYKYSKNLTRIVLAQNTERHVTNDIVEIWEMIEPKK